MKKFFLAGLITFLPIAVTCFLLIFVVDFLTAPFVGIAESFLARHGAAKLAQNYQYILLFSSRIIVLTSFLFLILVLGILGRRLFFSWVIHLIQRLFYKIPIIKTIYKITLEVSQSVFSEKKQNLFQGTVIVPFPSEKTLSVGLLARKTLPEIQSKKGNLQTVFIPNSPHAISGVLLFYDPKQVETIELSTETVFKFLFSCGTYDPESGKP